jgi:quercetin dioxygenase-like cupin family protein
MKSRFTVVAAVMLWAAGAVRLDSQTPTSHSTIEMSGVKPALKLQAPVEGFLTALNGKLDMRASEVEFEPGGGVKDHYHFGPGIRRVLAGELTLVDTEKGTEQVLRAGEFFYEAGDRNLPVYNRGKEPAKLLIVELVPAGWKASAMLPLARRAEAEQNGARLKELVCSAK